MEGFAALQQILLIVDRFRFRLYGHKVMKKTLIHKLLEI